MRDDLKKKISRNIIEIKRDIDAQELTDFFIAEEVLSFDEVDQINSYNPNTKENRNNAFLRILLKKDDKAFDVFTGALRQIGFDHLADLILNTETTAPSNGKCILFLE